MSEAGPHSKVRRWLRYAEEDLAVEQARAVLNSVDADLAQRSLE